jgi:hypothetical protein
MTSGIRGIVLHKQAIRFVGVFAVFLLSLGAFAAGVDTSGVDDMSDLSILAWAYYAAGLFVFGGLDLGVPAGGSAIGRSALWTAYLLAHLQAIQRVDPEQQLLLIDAEGDKIADDEMILLEGVHFLRMSLDRPEAFELLQLQHAARMVVIGDNDLLNLEIAWSAKENSPALPVAVHVTDLTLLRPVSRLVRGRAKIEGAQATLPLIFNTHRIAALHLYEHYLHPHFEETGYRDVVVLGGFGRFPQTILELLKVTAADELEHIVIVDKEASKNLRQFSADVSLESISFSTVDGDLEDPGTWEKVDSLLKSHAATPVYLLASAKEAVNFRAAMMLRRHSAEIRIFARCFQRGSFAESLARENAFELLAFEEVFQHALQDHYETLATL